MLTVTQTPLKLTGLRCHVNNDHPLVSQETPRSNFTMGSPSSMGVPVLRVYTQKNKWHQNGALVAPFGRP